MQTTKEMAIAFGCLFGLVLAFAKGLEWLTTVVSQKHLIILFAMLLPAALIQRWFYAGKLAFTAAEKKSLWGAFTFIMFFVFFAFAVYDIEDYGISKLGLPVGILGLLAMRNVEGLNIPRKFSDDPEMTKSMVTKPDSEQKQGSRLPYAGNNNKEK